MIIQYEADVAVVGAGPCGATLANLLGGYGVSTVLLDREPTYPDFPRAVAIDDESLRTLQTVGLVEEVLTDVIQNTPLRYYSSRHRLLAEIRPGAQPFGWPRRNVFYQPLLEGALRRGAERFDTVRTRYGATVTSLDQPPDGGARLAGQTLDGEDFEVRCRFAVGADGGRSFVRQQAGIELAGRTSPSKWLVVDLDEDSLHEPYSAVYCHPTRPTMTIPLPYGHRRFEFKLLPDEQDDAMTSEQAVGRLLEPFYRGVAMPKLGSARVYWHHSRTATAFRSGPVFLAGDAAHLQPPFFGQGMNSGLRDATNLAWKLAAVTSGRADEKILDSYDTERRHHAETMVSFASRIGRMYEPRNRATEAVRDAAFRAVQLVPGARDYILQMKYKPLPRYAQGLVLSSAEGGRNSLVGRMAPQPTVASTDGTRLRLDEVLGPAFALVGVGQDPARRLREDADADLADFWRGLGTVTVEVELTPQEQRQRPAAVTPSPAVGTASTADVVVHDVDGTFRALASSRPHDEILVLRPDRYVAAACRAEDLAPTLTRLRSMIGRPTAP